MAGAVAASIGIVLATGLWLPAQAALTDFGFDAPGDGEVTSSRVVGVTMRAESDAPKGLQYMQLRISGPGFSERVVWCAPGPAPSCPSWSGDDPTRQYRTTFNWDTRNLTQYNGDYTLKLIVREHDGGPAERSIAVRVNTPPATPSWDTVQPTTVSGRPAMILKWRANSEPDITQYEINRSASGGGGSTNFRVDATSPSSQGCSLNGGLYTCTDASFPTSGYGGTYTYYIRATRSSPVSPSGVRSGQAARSATVNEPRPSSSGGTGTRPGGGGTRPGGPTTGPGPSLQPTPALTPTPDPFAPFPGEFTSGTFEKTLPYRNPNTLKVMGERKARAAGFTEEVEVPLDVRRTLLPVAGGLFTVTAAAHFRRALRDSH